MYSAKKKASLRSGLSLEISQLETQAKDRDVDDTSCSLVQPKGRKVCCMSRLTETSFVKPFNLLICRVSDNSELLFDVLSAVNRLAPSSADVVVVFVSFVAQSNTSDCERRLKRVLADVQQATKDLAPSVRLLTVPCYGDTKGSLPSSQLTECLASYRDMAGDDWYEFWLGGVQFIVLNSMLNGDLIECNDNQMEQTEWLMAKLMERQFDDSSRVVVLCDALSDVCVIGDDSLDLPMTADSRLLMPNLLATCITHVIDCCHDTANELQPHFYVPITTKDEEASLLLLSFMKDDVKSTNCTVATLNEHLALKG